MNIKENFSLKALNSFGLDQKAKWFSTFNDVNDLQSILKSWEDDIHVLGGGSNILLTKDVDGLVLKNEIQGIKVIKEDSGKVFIEVGGGVIWHNFILHCLKNNLGGLENLSLIPGTVGAAPIQNIGAYGVEQQDRFVSLEYVDRSTFQTHKLSKSECHFGYRDSIFKRELKNIAIISKVVYALDHHEYKINTSYGAIQETLEHNGIQSPTIQDVSDAVISIRKLKLPDPSQIGNAGSFFKNPIIKMDVFHSIKVEYPNIPSYAIDDETVKIPAGWLIEQSGLKGYRLGNVGIHEKQALVLVNYGDAKGKDLLSLAHFTIDKVYEKFGVEIEPEVNIW